MAASENIIQRKALGRAAEIGLLYDVTREIFCGPSIFKKEPPLGIIKRIDIPHTDLKYEYEDSYKEKFSMLDVEAQLRISVLSGLFTLEGSGKYLSNTKNGFKSVKGSLIYKLSSVEENLNINHSDILTCFSMDALGVPGATHVVTGIKWGSTMVASFEHKNVNEKNVSQVSGILKANLEKLSPYIPVSGETLLNVEKERSDIIDHFSIKIFGDVVPDDKSLPQSFDDAKKIMAELPSYIKKYNNGKGVPIELKLYPLSKLARQLKQNITINYMIVELNEQTILRIERVFDDFLKSKKKLNDLYNDAQLISDHIPNDTFDEIEKYVRHIEIEETNIRKELADCLVEVRSGKSDISEIEQYICKFHDMLSKDSILAFIKKYKTVDEKASLMLTLKTKNVEYIKKDETINYILQINQDIEIYILLDNDEYIVGGNSSPEYIRFQDLYKDSNNILCKFFIAELKICTRIKGPGYPVILHYINGRPANDNYYFDDEEINILLLGETGVGKSTFINAFANYLIFESLEQARSGNMKVLIPSKFIITDSNYDEKTIAIGENDQNEQFENIGTSATQGCKCYVFHAANKAIKLIDTPGIGDTRGIDQDAKNFENILTHISHYRHLNGICILLKPNNARLSLVFKYCILALLTHLARSAKDNIVFCFTNSRGTFYRPGDTLTPLRKYLNDLYNVSGVEIKVQRDTTYCFDNESFRFLAAIKNNVQFEDEIKTFANSWEESVKESRRLLRHITSRSPHKVKDTLSLNNARRLVKLLIKPLEDIQPRIESYINYLGDIELELEKSNKAIEDLKMTKFDIEMVKSSRTICNMCTEDIQTDNNIQRKCNKICCDNCRVKFASKFSILFCSVIGINGICKICGCSWKLHIHTAKLAKKKCLASSGLELQINENKNKAAIRQVLIDDYQESVKDMLEESDKIIKIKRKFILFLKQNSIAIINDTVEGYLEYFINLEKNNQNSQANERIKMYEEQKTEAIKENRWIYEGSENEQNEQNEYLISLNDINELEKILYSLPICGPILYEEKLRQEYNQENEFRYAENHYNVPENTNIL
ncbi:9112_t:CDS:1 [Cetraspora pellucida]|uniref:9112_t:CDS:1 n=1 Tax=Cetraspora pellucida TaxID=1433469 RepID=A0A9N9P5P2_9GLOM|nr:9112_t:CDS:1 [Cetraspora pellucida]